MATKEKLFLKPFIDALKKATDELLNTEEKILYIDNKSYLDNWCKSLACMLYEVSNALMKAYLRDVLHSSTWETRVKSYNTYSAVFAVIHQAVPLIWQFGNEPNRGRADELKKALQDVVRSLF